MNKKILLLGALSASLVLVGCGQQPQPKPQQPETPAVSSGENMPSEQSTNSPDMPNPETSGEDMMTPPVESGSETTGTSEVSTGDSSTTSESEITSGTSSSTTSSDVEPSAQGMGE